jgi:tetratricopeptide (TPR) repeat protein
MKVPDWRKVDLGEGVLREATLDNKSIILWLPGESAESLRHWERIGSVPGAEITAEEGLCATAATSIRASQQVRGLFGKLFGRFRETAGGRTWVLPNGESAEQQGERQTDLLLVWAEDDGAPLDEARVRSRWPQGKQFRRIGKNLFLVSGIEPAADVPMSPAGSPPEQAEKLLAAARQAGDRRREALALDDLGVVLTRSGKAAQAVAPLEEALAITRQLGDRALEGEMLGHLGMAVVGLGPPARAFELLEKSLAYAREAGDRFAEKAALERLGHACSAARDPARALYFYGQALALARQAGDRQHEADLLWDRTIQHAEMGRPDQAAAEGQAAVDVLRKMNHPHADWFAVNLQKYLRGDVGAALPAPAGMSEMFYGGEVISTWGPPVPPPSPGQATAGPGLLRQAINAAKSMAKFLGSGLKTVPDEAYRKRLRTCAACEHHTGVRCRLCGCFTSLKARMPHEQCPVGKWPV